MVDELDIDDIIQLKKQISNIQYKHQESIKTETWDDGDDDGWGEPDQSEEVKGAEKEQEKKEPAMVKIESSDDPEKMQFWEDVLAAADEEQQMELLMELTKIGMQKKLSKRQSQVLESGFKLMKREKVWLHYEYWIDQAELNESMSEGQEQPMVFITGQFNNWCLEEMKVATDKLSVVDQDEQRQGKVLYKYDKEVDGAQIYNYYMIVNGVRKTDPEQNVAGKANWIFVPMSTINQEKANVLFQKPLAMRMLKLKNLARAIQYMQLKKNISDEELEKKKTFAVNYNRLLITVNQDLLGRFIFNKTEALVYSNSTSPQRGYLKVVDFSITPNTSEIKAQRILDQHGVLLNTKKFQNVTTISLDDFIRDYEVPDKNEEIKIKREINQTRKYWFFIRYFAENGECLPMEIKPSDMNVMDYDINFDMSENKIRSITNKKFNTEVRFYDLNQEQLDGYVEGSALDVWTQLDPYDKAGETVNIMHIHVNDTSEQVTFDTACMHEGETLGQFQEFKTDMSGQKLRYKILLKNNAIFKILYNMGVNDDDGFNKTSDELRPNVKSLPFNEHRLHMEDTYVNKSEGTDQMLMKVESVPSGMICSLDYNKVQAHEQRKLKYDMTCDCNDRIFEDLPGYVDVNVMAHYSVDEKAYMPLDEVRKVSFPCCQLTQASKQILQEYDEQCEKLKAQAETQFMGGLDELKKLIEDGKDMLEQYHQKAITKDDAKAFISKYQQKLNEVEESYDDVEDKGDEVEELLEEAQQLVGKLVRATRF